MQSVGVNLRVLLAKKRIALFFILRTHNQHVVNRRSQLTAEMKQGTRMVTEQSQSPLVLQTDAKLEMLTWWGHEGREEFPSVDGCCCGAKTGLNMTHQSGIKNTPHSFAGTAMHMITDFIDLLHIFRSLTWIDFLEGYWTEPMLQALKSNLADYFIFILFSDQL